MIDETRTAASLAASLAAAPNRAPATLDAGAFDAALTAAREHRAQADDPFALPRRAAGASAGHRDPEPASRSEEPDGPRTRTGADDRADIDPQAQVLAARQDAAAQADRLVRHRRLADRGTEAQATAQRLAEARVSDAAQTAARAARADKPASGPRPTSAPGDTGAAETSSSAAKASESRPAAARTERTERTERHDPSEATATPEGEIPSDADGRHEPLAPEIAGPQAATALIAGPDPLNPATAASAAATAAPTAAPTAARAETLPGTAANGTASQAGMPAATQPLANATPSVDPGRDTAATAAGRATPQSARAAGPDAASSGPATPAASGSAEPGMFRLELLGASGSTPASAAMGVAAPRPPGSSAPGPTQGTGALQRAARDAGATAISLDWRIPGSRPDLDPSAQSQGGMRSEATMLLEAIQESRGATAPANDSGASLNAAGSFASALALANVADASAGAATPETARMENPWPVQDPAFAEHLAGQVSEALVGGIERAEITLNPRELGPIRIELSLSGENASIAFSAAQPETRAAIEQTLPILRNLLSEHGLALTQTTVNGGGADPSGNGQPQRGAADFAPTSGSSGPMAGESIGSEPIARSPRAARGLLDLFA